MYSNSFYPESECRDFHVTGDQMHKLKRQLDASGAEDWYCHYFSPVLDGTQWGALRLGRVLRRIERIPQGIRCSRCVPGKGIRLQGAHGRRRIRILIRP